MPDVVRARCVNSLVEQHQITGLVAEFNGFACLVGLKDTWFVTLGLICTHNC